MVILQFNKLIRNKWFWGAFAILISIVFVLPDDWFSSRGEDGFVQGQVGTIDGKPVMMKDFAPILDDVRLQHRQDAVQSDKDFDREARELFAAMAVAERNGAVATDAAVVQTIKNDPSFQQDGVFNHQKYAYLLRQNGLDEAHFEELQRRSVTLGRFDAAVLSGATWASPMEVERAVADMTDELTVKVARFSQDPKAAAAVKLDDAGLKKWYEANTNSLALPERVKIRYVKFDATKTNLLARMTVTDAEIQEYYDTTADRYTTTDTNGVETVKKLEEVKPEIEKTLRQVAAVECLETNLNARIVAGTVAKGVSRLDAIAKADGLKVETSDWFSFEQDKYVEGFMRRSFQILPGAENFIEQVADLDMEDENFRYVVIRSDKAVWLVEKAAVSPAHLPTFAEAKDIIRPRALRDAKADAFKATVEAEIAKGAKAVLAAKDVSTNLTFVVSEMTGYGFEDQGAVARAAMKLKKGEVSECTVTRPGRALVVVCVDRKPGDPAKKVVNRERIAQSLSMMQSREIAAAWRKWNVERLGFKAAEESQADAAAEAE